MPKILIVDDEPDAIELIRFALGKEGYDVFSATNGLEALNQARAILPDVILLDLMLPELDGVAVCEILRRLPSTARIPIIMLTAWKTEAARATGLEVGANAYLTKPFNLWVLLVEIQKLLECAPDGGDINALDVPE